MLAHRVDAVIERLGRITEDGNDRDAATAGRTLLDAELRWRDAAYVETRLTEVEQAHREQQAQGGSS